MHCYQASGWNLLTATRGNARQRSGRSGLGTRNTPSWALRRRLPVEEIERSISDVCWNSESGARSVRSIHRSRLRVVLGFSFCIWPYPSLDLPARDPFARWVLLRASSSFRVGPGERSKCLAEKCRLMLQHCLKQWSFSYGRVSSVGRNGPKNAHGISAVAVRWFGGTLEPGSALPRALSFPEEEERERESVSALFRRSGPSP